jgi:hypothetical protein
MIAILGSFDNRLSTLETAIRPTQVRFLHLPPSSSPSAAWSQENSTSSSYPSSPTPNSVATQEQQQIPAGTQGGARL